MLTLNVERRRVLDFEVGSHRRSPLQVRSSRQKPHPREIFLRAIAIGPIAATLDCVYNRRALITVFQRKGTAR